MRIAVIGPQNTGKTTFIKDFLVAFPSYVTPEETYRDIVKKYNLPINQEATEESQRIITNFLYEQIVSNTEKNIVFDRCVIDNYVYSYYSMELGAFRSEFVNEIKSKIAEQLKYLDMIVLVPTALTVCLVDDNLRDSDKKFIDFVNRIFIDILLEIARESKIKIVTITGSREERVSLMRRFLV